MRTCPICGSAMQAEARFCPSCGSPSSLSCPLCTSAVEDSWHFCPVCSASLLHLCPSCGTFVSVIAKYCKACGWTLAVRPVSGVVPRPAAVLVARVEARHHGEPADPASLRSLVTGALAAAESAATNANGIVQRLVGDRIRAVFGLQEPEDGDAERALSAAADVIRALRPLQAAAGEIGATLDVRVGVDAGEVIVPDPSAREPIVAGDAAVVADRLSQVGPAGQILAGEGAQPAVSGDLRLGRELTIDVGGGEIAVARRLLLPGEVEGPSAAGEVIRDANGPEGDEREPEPADTQSNVGFEDEPGRESEAEAGRASETAGTMEQLGDDQVAAGLLAEAIDSYLVALTLARPDPDLARDRSRLCVKALRLATREDGPPTLDPVALEGLAAEGMAGAPDEESRAWLLALKGACHRLWDGLVDPVAVADRILSAEQARSLAESLGSLELQGFVGLALDTLYWAGGEYSRALDNARRMLRLIDRLESPERQAELLVRSGHTILYTEGNFGEVSELGRRGLSLSGGLGPHALMHATFLLVSAAYYRGRWGELQPALQEHLTAFAKVPHDRCGLVRGAPALGALTLAQMGDVEAAAELARVTGYDPSRPEGADGILARYAVAAGDPETGRRIAETILSATDDPEATLALVEALLAVEDWEALSEFVPSARGMVDAMALLGPACDRAEGLAEAAAGKRWAATELLKGALGAFERLSVPFEAARTREALAGIALPEEARDYLEHAIATYERLGAIPARERARAHLVALDEPPATPSATSERAPSDPWPGAWSGIRRAGF